MKYAMFIGRWQTWHRGHQWLIHQQLKKGKNICIAVRDVEPDSDNPWNAHQTKQSLEYKFRNNERIKVIIIPDIESVNYGRGVGYEVIEHVPPEEIKKISGTKIRFGPDGLPQYKEEHSNWENEGGSNLSNLPPEGGQGGHY